MKTEHAISRRLIVTLLLAAIALASALWLAGLAASPEHNAASLARLDEQKVTVLELTAASAAASVAVSAVPGDATTPIANQIAQLSSYLLLVTGAILLEKILLTLTGYLAFGLLIPAACVLGALSLYIPRRITLRQLALKLAVFGLALWLVIPASLRLGTLVEDAFDVQQTVDLATQAADSAPDSQEAESGSWLSQIGEAITGAVSGAVDWAENTLSRFVDAVAALVIVNCVIPLLVLWLLLWLVKAVWSIRIEIPSAKILPSAKKDRERAIGQEAGGPGA